MANNIRAEAEPAIAGCRITGYVAARICDPMRGRAPPELALPGEAATGHCSRPPSLGQLACRPGESGSLTHNTTQS